MTPVEHPFVSIVGSLFRWAFLALTLPAPSTLLGQSLEIVKLVDLPYGEAINDQGINQSLHLDLYHIQRQVSDARPVIMLVHGGGFRAGDKQQDLYQEMARTFARQGYVAISINYRLKTVPFQKVALDNAVADALQALQWIKGQANEYGIDTTKIIIAGDSAGGAIAVHAAFRSPQITSFVGCIDLWGGLCPEDPKVEYIPPWDQPIFTDAIKPETPPTLIIHGSEDQVVPIRTSHQLVAKLEAAGVFQELVIVDGAKHYPSDRVHEYIPKMVSFANRLCGVNGVW